MIKIESVIWFIGRNTIGIVITQPKYGDKKAYIGMGLDNNEADDIKHIAMWGTKFPLPEAISITEQFGIRINIDI